MDARHLVLVIGGTRGTGLLIARLLHRQGEADLRASGLEYTVIRAGFLLNRPGGRHLINVTQAPLPLSLRYRIARADLAEVFRAALDHPRAARATFEAVWGPKGHQEMWPGLLDRLQPDV